MTTSRAPAKIIPQAFPGIHADEVSELINASQLENFLPGVVLCQENAVEDSFYLILEGEVEVTKVINNAERRLLKTLRAGDFFGEMALIHNAPRAATVKTLTPLLALVIRKADFDRVLQNSSSVSRAMVREISKRLRENDELAIDDLRIRASELAEAYQKLAEQDVARREFLTNISHQLRTPLTAAGGFLQMLEKGVVPADKTAEVIGTVARNVQQINSLVNDILFVQEMELILDQFEPVKLADLARKVAAKLEDKARAGKVSLKVKPDLILPSVLGDAPSLERALTALVDNAIKFSPDGGDVEIRLRRKGDQVAVEVRDHGIGIDPQVLPHIFDRFYHLDKSGERLFEGIGLGLAITRQVIQQHKGRLEVDSKPGQGSTFTMWLGVGKEGAAPAESSLTF
jgi:signal transduction histidine kinase